MITQKGLKNEDVFALISENMLEVSIHIGIPECEKFTVVKNYSSKEDYSSNIQKDIDLFIASHAQTTFTVKVADDGIAEEPVVEEDVINDSWSAIFRDAKDEVKSKFRR